MKYFLRYLVRHKILLLLTLLLLLAAFFRFYNLNWDQGNFFHPDERNIDNAVAKISFFSQLNPGFFAYGGFSIYLYRATAEVLMHLTHDSQWILNWQYINIIGRFFSAFFSTLTIIPLYFLAKRVGNKQIAVVSCILYTFTVSSIQIAHFGVTESLFTFTGVLICWLSYHLMDTPSIKHYLLIGALIGIAGATKTTELGFLLFLGAAHVIVSLNYKNQLTKFQWYFLLSLIVGVVTFTIFSPYTFLSWSKFIESMQYESGVATGTLSVPYTLQFNGSIPYIFQFVNFFWQMGIVAIMAISGFGYVLYRMIVKRERELVIFFSFPIAYFVYAGDWHTKFIRYMAPLLPFFIIGAAIILTTIMLRWRKFGIVLITLFLFATSVWALTFFSIYTHEQTRITASKWIYQNIPTGSVIYTEHWDDGLPIPIGGFSPSQYTIEPLTIYDPDTDQKLIYYSEMLSNGNYIVINSRRLYGTLMRLTKDYPLTSQYYRLLFLGKLGYRQIKQFSSYPQLLGIPINDDGSEETFQVYDHPKVLIFKNEDHLNQQTLHDILQAAWHT